LNCEQIQSHLLDKNQHRFSTAEKQHLNSCASCRSFAEFNGLIENAYLQETPESAPDYIKQNLLREFRSPKESNPGFMEMLRNRFPAPYRAGLAFAFSLLFIALVFRPYFRLPAENQSLTFSLFEQQDSLIQHNLHFIYTQKLGISSSADTLLSGFLQTFP